MSSKPAKIIAQNRRARHDYELERELEAGIELTGGEVKSAKAGHLSIQEAFVQVRKGEVWLVGAYIKPWPAAGGEPDPTRTRKLLLKREEIAKLIGESRAGSRTIVPTKVYLKQALIKVTVAVGRGKKQYDKRQALKARQAKREAEQAIKAD